MNWKYQEGSKRYNALSEYLKNRFGCRVHKIAVDAGFSCPNRDGRISTGGCIFCNPIGSGAAYINKKLSVSQQIMSSKEFLRRRYNAGKFIAYFQAFTNTYAPVEKLKQIYEEAIGCKDVVGIAVGTRPDCVADEVLDLLADIQKQSYLSLELGLQSIYDKSLSFINRGHDFSSFVDAVERCKERDLSVCAHVILGLPQETQKDMFQTAKVISDLGVDGIKIHVLHVLKDTKLEKMFLKGEIKLLEMDEYVQIVCTFLENLSPEILIHRLTGEASEDILVAPEWCKNKIKVLNGIQHELDNRNSYQGLKRRKGC